MLKTHERWDENACFILFLNRTVCWRDSCVWRDCSNWLHHWTHVHHRWRGWGETEMQFFIRTVVKSGIICLSNQWLCNVLKNFQHCFVQQDIFAVLFYFLVWKLLRVNSSKCFSNVVRYQAKWNALFSISKVHNYKRLTPFSISNQAVESLDNLKPGDCIVCFSKNDIYSISRQIEIRGLECAVIYGSLPPGRICSDVSFMIWKVIELSVVKSHCHVDITSHLDYIMFGQQAPSWLKLRSLMIKRTLAKSLLPQMQLEWVLTCKSFLKTVALICFINTAAEKNSKTISKYFTIYRYSTYIGKLCFCFILFLSDNESWRNRSK